MFMHPRKLIFVSLAIAFVLGGIFGNYRTASAAVVMDEEAGVYTDDFASAAGVAASAGVGVDIADGTVKLKNGNGDFTPDYLASGTVTINAITPLRIAKWNTLSIVASMPEGTSIKAQVMDDHSHLFKDFYLPGNAVGISAFPIDLGNISTMQCGDSYFLGDSGTSFNTCNHPGKVIVKFTLTTSNQLVTPSIDSMQVTWTLRQGDNSPSIPAQEGWFANQHDQQGTFWTEASNSAVYPVFRWATSRYPGDAEGRNMLVSGGKVFAPIGFATSRLLGLDADTGTEIWQMPNGYNSPYGSISAAGTFYGHDYDIDRLNAIDIATGTLKWSYNFYGGHGTDGAIIGSDGTIFTVRNYPNEYSATVYAFNPDGTTKWANTFAFSNVGGDQYVLSRLSSAVDGTIYFSYHTLLDGAPNDYGLSYLDDSYLIAVNPTDGIVKWGYQTGDTSLEAPIVGPDGTIYVAKQFYTRDHELQIVAVNPDGTLKWRKNFGTGDFGFTNLAMKSDGNLYALYSTLGLDYSGDMTLMELSKTDGSTLWSAPMGKSFISVGLPYFTYNFFTTDGTDGLHYVDASYSDPVAELVRLNYLDAGHDLRWQIPYAYDSDGGNILYSMASQVMDDRGWIYSVLGKTVHDETGHYVPSQQFAQAFALAPWTLTPTSPAAYRNGTLNFSVTTSMQQTNPLTDEANKMQVVLEDDTKIPLTYSSTNGDGDTIWTASYTVSDGTAFGTHSYTVEANAALVKTDIVTAFASPATGSENTGLTAAGTYTVLRSGTSSGGGGTVPAASISVRTPAGGATYNPGTTVGLDWTSANGTFTQYKVSYTTDNGINWTAIADNMTSQSLSWIVPAGGTINGLIKVEGYDQSGTLLATGMSGSFTVTGTRAPEQELGVGQAPAADSNVSGAYDAATAKSNTPDINTDKQLPTAPPFTAWCVSGSLIKTESSPAVYYCANDGKRYVFVNDKAYFSWYPDFSTVQTINEQTMAEIVIGGNITYRPGSRMIKILSDPKVYAVARGGILRWVMTEATAARLYGVAWNTMIDDVPDSFFVNYAIGEPITE